MNYYPQYNYEVFKDNYRAFTSSLNFQVNEKNMFFASSSGVFESFENISLME